MAFTPLHCPHRPPCPGCPRLGNTGIATRALTALDLVCGAAGITRAPAVESAPTGFRHRARLAVRGRAASPKIGIFQQGSHQIVDIPNCLVHHPRINLVAAAVKTTMRALGVVPYADAPHRGQLRYLQAVVERPTERVQLVLVGNDLTPQALTPLADALWANASDLLHSIWWNGQPERSNTIIGPHWHHWHGPAAVCESIGGAQVFFPPGAFGQGNLDGADRIVALAHSWVPDGARVVELYAGCGPIGLGLAHRAAHVAMNESAPGGVDGLALGIAALPDAARARAGILPGAATAHTAALAGADVVIADPPRKGVDAAVMAALAAAPPRRLILVSCDVEAFQRDARALMAAGMALRQLVPFALFPHTEHVETVALFERA